MCKEKKAGDKMDHMRKEQPATKIIQFPRGTDVVSNLYCKRCGALVGMCNNATKERILDGNFCRECGQKLTKATMEKKEI